MGQTNDLHNDIFFYKNKKLTICFKLLLCRSLVCPTFYNEFSASNGLPKASQGMLRSAALDGTFWKLPPFRKPNSQKVCS